MFSKYVLFRLYSFSIMIVPCLMNCKDIDLKNKLTEEYYNNLKGPDLCGELKSNVEAQKKACNDAALYEGAIPCGETLSFKKGYPCCFDIKIQLYDCNGKKSKTADGNVLDCTSEQLSFVTGRGEGANDLIEYKCNSKSNTCEAVYSQPDAYS